MTEDAMRADWDTTKRLCDHLVAAFEKFAESEAAKSEEGLRYLDALMGCHNFYKTIILDLERRSGDKRVRAVALATLREALP